MSIQGIDNHDLLNINLLPEDFVQERIRRRNNRHQRRTAGLFLIIVAICSWQHFDRSHRLLQERDQTLQSVGQITQQLQDPALSRTELEALEARASLITFLRVRGLPSQVFRMLDKTRPEEVLLTSMKISQVTPSKNSAVPNRNSLPQDDATKSQTTGIHRDLQQLQQETRDRHQEIRLEGEAPDDLTIAAFFGKLRRYPLSEDVKLEYTDDIEGKDNESGRRFAIVISLKSPLQMLQEAGPDVPRVATNDLPESPPAVPLQTTEFSRRGENR